MADALVSVLTAATGGTVSVFDHPPLTLNPPALVVSRATGRYAQTALGIDEMELPVVVVGAADADDDVDDLAEVVRQAIAADPTLGGAVPGTVVPTELRDPRNQTVAGVEVLTTQVVLTVRM